MQKHSKYTFNCDQPIGNAVEGECFQRSMPAIASERNFHRSTWNAVVDDDVCHNEAAALSSIGDRSNGGEDDNDVTRARTERLNDARSR